MLKSRLFSHLLTLFLLLALVPRGYAQETAEPKSPIRALLVTGGGWHDYETQKKLLTEGIRKQLGDRIQWTIVHEDKKGDPTHHVSLFRKRDWPDEYDVVVHNTGYGRVKDAGFVARLVRSHQGTPAVLIHASVMSYRYAEPADPWFEFVGLQSMWHEDQRRLTVENIAPDHPIMDGVPDSLQTPKDELYVIKKKWDEITPLAQAYGTQTETYQPVAWTHEINGTRVFATTLGHNNKIFQQEAFIRMITNGLLWAVGEK